MPKMRERHADNPFWEQYGESIASKTYKSNKVIGVDYINSETGESHQALIEDKEARMIDVRPFAKIAATEEVRNVLLSLQPTSTKMFFWLIKELVMNQDSIIINGLRAQRELAYSHINSIYQGLAGLEEAGVLAPAFGGAWNYWINPVIFYMGDATIMYKANAITRRLRKKNKNKDLEIKVITAINTKEVTQPGYHPVWDMEPLPSNEEITPEPEEPDDW